MKIRAGFVSNSSSSSFIVGIGKIDDINLFEQLKEKPYLPRSGADIKKLEGSFDPALYRIRVGEYRAIYAIIEKEVRITTILHRSKGYKWLE